VIDIDILYYEDIALEGPELTLPHPALLARAFVLVPLAEIRPDLVLAGHPIRTAAAAIDAVGVAVIAPPWQPATAAGQD
jgi:2-amino-4-hydroxy-6-hydroxymethyldihydropteridine diphosphokinase